MTSSDLKAWQINMGYTQQQACDELGIARATYCDMLRGVHRGSKKPVVIDKAICLACLALHYGISYLECDYIRRTT